MTVLALLLAWALGVTFGMANHALILKTIEATIKWWKQ